MKTTSFIIIAVVLFMLANVFSPTFSEGNRVGMITKFSHKGIIFKSYEGEMNSGGLRKSELADESLTANTFEFSVNDTRIVNLIDSAMSSGIRVQLSYDQHLWAPYNLSTAYIITDVKFLK
jgi:hypothetical protein